MSITETKSAFTETKAVSIELEKMFSVTAAAGNPAYLVVTTLDRNEYTAGSTGATGSLTGNGHTMSLAGIGGDARSAGIVFTYQASTGHYINATFGDLDQVSFTASASAGDLTDISLFGTANLSLATGYAASPYGMMQYDAAGYLGTATVVTQPSLIGAAPPQATPDSIAQAARNFVGQYCNVAGCWNLASTIAADAGAALPMQSAMTGLAGHASGEWIVAFNGPTGQSGNWQSMVKAGEIVVIGTPGGGGHVTTCVAGAGATAMLVDNIANVNAAGQVLNSAHDGSASDIVIETGHAATTEWTGVQAATVVIYELDTPAVTDTVASDKLASGAAQSLASLFSATDPAGHAITSWQVYNSAAGDALLSGGASHLGDNNSNHVLTVASLGAVSLLAGAAATDTLKVRAFNGSFWGDWQSLPVTIAAPTILVTPTGSQVWTDGSSENFLVSPATFTDALKLPMHFAAFEVAGPSVASWLQVDAATGALIGTVPALASGTVELAVIATDAQKLTGTDLFSVTFVAGSAELKVAPLAATPAMAALFSPPEPSNMLAFHS